MLSRIFIQNYAIIEELQIEFSSHLNIITGETGAGKSIIVGALNLVLGNRADSSVLFNREKKSIVEAYFKPAKEEDFITHFLKENELDVQDELVLRREISPNGKSRAFINDTPVTLLQLNVLSSHLVDLHQQFDTLNLGEKEFQHEVLDALAANFFAIKKYQQVFLNVQKLKKQLEDLKDQKLQFNKEFDYHQFQFNELEETALKENEIEDIEGELKLLSSAEGIKAALSKAHFDLEESETPVVRQLKSIINNLNTYKDYVKELPALIDRVESAYIELQDIASEFDSLSADINADAATIEKLNDKLSLGYKLLKKHGVKTTNELLDIKEELNKKLEAVLNIDDAIEAFEKDFQKSLSDAIMLAEEISVARKNQVKPLEDQVNKMLVQVGMPGARLKVDLKPVELSFSGADEIEFLFDANKSNHFHPLRKVASGGELSRLMLCIKSLVAKSINLPTMIFDEIDTGISGEAAKQVGVIMKDLANARQVVCITHQPQIAGMADAHFMVYKALAGNAVTTGVKLLDKDERIVAIAKMLSGEKPTAAAIENAREMVMN